MPRILTVPLGDTQLPVVDITNPAFASLPSDDELAAMTAQYVQESAQNQEASPQLRAALSQSRLGSGLMAARGTYLTGLNTYLLKIGPDNLPADFHPIDRRIAASFPAVTTRLRLHDMAVLISDGLVDALSADSRRRLHFINIAGGPAADTWNSVLRLRQADSSLERRDISVRVLDLDEEGPAFGARVFAALQTENAPLAGFHIRFAHQPYNWATFHDLKRILGSADLKQSACAVSSEGGLFEYGSDDEIIGNLTALHELMPDDAIVVGSACRESDLTRIHAGIGVTLRPRTRQAFGALVERAGWRVDTFIERPFNDSVRLVKGGRA
jgi:hypothetical protein